MLLCRTLPPGMIDGVLPFQNDFRNRDKGISFLQKILNNSRQRRRGILRRVVEQDDTSRLDFGCHPLGNVRGGQVFPVQAVTIPYKGKPMCSSTII